jgi:hypothetical protein
MVVSIKDKKPELVFCDSEPENLGDDRTERVQTVGVCDERCDGGRPARR